MRIATSTPRRLFGRHACAPARRTRYAISARVLTRARLSSACALRSPLRSSEADAVGVAVAVGAGVGVAVGGLGGEFAEDDDAGGAAVDAEGAAGADVFVDDEGDVVFGVFAGAFGVGGGGDGVDGDHVDAFPGADVDAAFAEDAFGLVDVEELLGFDRAGEVGAVDLVELVVGREVRHRRVRIRTCHIPTPRSSWDGGSDAAGDRSATYPTPCLPRRAPRPPPRWDASATSGRAGCSAGRTRCRCPRR